MKAKKPNILWLMSDQHNANCMGAAGHPDVRTPNLDRIAHSGVQFNRAYCNNPVCGPSRCSFLSGQYVRSHGIAGNYNRDVESSGSPNLARLFQQNGYETALIGKAHLPWQWLKEGFGFIRFSDLCDAQFNDPTSCHYFKDLIDAGLADKYDHGTFFPGDPRYGDRAFISELPEEFSLEAWTGRKAVEFLDQRDRQKPFFLNVSFQRPHNPYSPPAERADEYDASALHLPDNACDYLERGFAGKPQFQQEYMAGKKGMGYPFRSHDRKELRVQMAAHFTLITMIDEAIGEILKSLESHGELDNTIIAYVADHGDFAGEHGLMSKNLGIYESIHRIPFLLSGPGVTKDVVRDTIVESVDLYPTLVELAGLTCESGVDGVSRTKEITTGKGGLDSTICEWEFVSPQNNVHAIRNDHYRFVYYDTFPDDGELYDCQADPGELNNLFQDVRYQAVRNKFIKQLEEYRVGVKRVYRWSEDAPKTAKTKYQASVRIQKFGAKWSDICTEVSKS